MKKLKERWGIDSNLALFLILLVFALTGSTSVKIAKPVLDYLGFHRTTFPDGTLFSILYWVVRILIIFPLYQVLLIAFGWLFGQFKFFWAFEKKMLARLGFKKFL